MNANTLALVGGTCVLLDAQGQFVLAETDLLIENGKIKEIGPGLATRSERVMKCHGLHILPGAIDAQVHFREPGLTHKEDLATGSMGAILGGITTVFEMPNTKPSTVNAIDFQDKLDRAKGRMWSHYAFFIGASGENADRLGELEKLPHCSGVKIFMGSSTGTLLVADDATLERTLANGQRRVSIHAEDEPRLLERKHIAMESHDVRMHPVWRDELTAILATERLLKAARKTGRPVHVLHVTTAEEMEILRKNKDIATVETTPQHLTLCAPECYERLGTKAQMNPPIRDERHQKALWQAINDGTVTNLGSDHAPHTLEEKAKPYPESPSGMTGVQTLLPLMLNHVNNGKLPLFRLVDLISRGPARAFGVQGKGAIAVGMDADLTVVDLKKERTIEDKWIASKSQWTPFHGMKVKGWPIATIIDGKIVMRDDQVIGSPQGRGVVFKDTSEQKN